MNTLERAKYRAKRIDNGEWVVGTGLTDFLNSYPDDDKFCMWSDYSWVLIDPETLGQFTGLKDKNGVDIFEGDIVKTTYQNDLRVEAVKYDKDRGFTPMHEPCDYDEIYLDESDIEIIGNTHDNPELLEVAK